MGESPRESSDLQGVGTLLPRLNATSVEPPPPAAASSSDGYESGSSGEWAAAQEGAASNSKWAKLKSLRRQHSKRNDVKLGEDLEYKNKIAQEEYASLFGEQGMSSMAAVSQALITDQKKRKKKKGAFRKAAEAVVVLETPGQARHRRNRHAFLLKELDAMYADSRTDPDTVRKFESEVRNMIRDSTAAYSKEGEFAQKVDYVVGFLKDQELEGHLNTGEAAQVMKSSLAALTFAHVANSREEQEAEVEAARQALVEFERRDEEAKSAWLGDIVSSMAGGTTTPRAGGDVGAGAGAGGGAGGGDGWGDVFAVAKGAWGEGVSDAAPHTPRVARGALTMEQIEAILIKKGRLAPDWEAARRKALAEAKRVPMERLPAVGGAGKKGYEMGGIRPPGMAYAIAEKVAQGLKKDRRRSKGKDDVGVGLGGAQPKPGTSTDRAGPSSDQLQSGDAEDGDDMWRVASMPGLRLPGRGSAGGRDSPRTALRQSNLFLAESPRGSPLGPNTPRGGVLGPNTPRGGVLGPNTPRGSVLGPNTPRGGALGAHTPVGRSRGGLRRPWDGTIELGPSAFAEEGPRSRRESEGTAGGEEEPLHHLGFYGQNPFPEAQRDLYGAEEKARRLSIQAAHRRESRGSHGAAEVGRGLASIHTGRPPRQSSEGDVGGGGTQMPRRSSGGDIGRDRAGGGAGLRTTDEDAPAPWPSNEGGGRKGPAPPTSPRRAPKGDGPAGDRAVEGARALFAVEGLDMRAPRKSKSTSAPGGLTNRFRRAQTRMETKPVAAGEAAGAASLEGTKRGHMYIICRRANGMGNERVRIDAPAFFTTDAQRDMGDMDEKEWLEYGVEPNAWDRPMDFAATFRPAASVARHRGPSSRGVESPYVGKEWPIWPPPRPGTTADRGGARAPRLQVPRTAASRPGGGFQSSRGDVTGHGPSSQQARRPRTQHHGARMGTAAAARVVTTRGFEWSWGTLEEGVDPNTGNMVPASHLRRKAMGTARREHHARSIWG